MGLAKFLEARIADDEAHWEGDADWGDAHGTCYECGANQARMLREVDAKRKILAEHTPNDPCDAHDASLRSIPCDTLRALAAIWSDHPDYDKAWEGADDG